jgi:hypothetical protein
MDEHSLINEAKKYSGDTRRGLNQYPILASPFDAQNPNDIQKLFAKTAAIVSVVVIKAVKNNALKNAVNKFISLTGFEHPLSNKPINVIDQLITEAISRFTHSPNVTVRGAPLTELKRSRRTL